MGEMQKSSFSERAYIAKRKMKAFAHSLAFYVCRVFPVKPNKIVMWTFECGGGYGCSPKYVAEEILKRNREGKTDYQIVWLLDNTERDFPPEIQKVKSSLWSRAYHLSTAGVWVSNTRTFYGTKKRKNQCYIQTWHATIGIKPIGKYRGAQFPPIACLVSEADSQMIDYVLSDSAWCDHTYRKGLVYDGEIVRTGTPRCDVLFNQRAEKRKLMREVYHIPQDAKILLYAPTFRGGSQSGSRSVSAKNAGIDFELLTAALEKRFGGTWYVFLRLHPQLAAQARTDMHRSGRLVDVTQRPDMNEIIAGADAFLTDYSSAVFEAAIAGLPGFIYADDLEEYVADRGDLMFDLYRLPFPVAQDMDGLKENILKFDDKAYQERLDGFWREVELSEDGMASARVVDLIQKSADLR